MEPKHTSRLTETGKIGIGKNKYQFLKTLPDSDLTEQEKFDIAEYEARNVPTEEQDRLKREYAQRILIESPTTDSVITKGWLWRTFLERFKENEGVDFQQTPESIQNVKAVMTYFLKHDDFLFCENVNPLSKPSFDKGLLIVGDYGCGKSSVMKALQKTLYGIKGYHFRFFNTNEIVKIFEAINGDNIGEGFNRREFDNSMTTGAICFDDLKSERIASNYGKVNLFKEIFEIRSQKPFKTYVTMNYREGMRGDVQAAVDEIAIKYGERVYDRVYEMFNIVEFNGKSFRI